MYELNSYTMGYVLFYQIYRPFDLTLLFVVAAIDFSSLHFKVQEIVAHSDKWTMDRLLVDCCLNTINRHNIRQVLELLFDLFFIEDHVNIIFLW